jgi:hypothetical protein
VRLACLALLLCACLPPPAESADRRALDAVCEAWRAAELPLHGRCLEYVEIVRHPTIEAYRAQCQIGHSAGCVRSEIHGMPARDYAQIHVAPGYHHDEGLVQHEALHWLILRGGVRVPGADEWDSQHSDPRVWESGGPASVQQRARARLIAHQGVLGGP